MSKCAECGVYACRTGQREKVPGHCPMNLLNEVYQEAKEEYRKPDVLNIALNSALTESAGYRKWTRLEEIIQFSRRAGFQKLGLAFCVGLRKEAAEVVRILKQAGFTVESVMCKTGSMPKELLGVREEQKVRPGQFEPMCNPIAQAKILNRAGTEFNILLGLCVGHDSLLIKYAEAPVTVLAVKDRVLAHNPLGAVYAAHYYGPVLAAYKKAD
ncbi:DUF1847 domain-containing protein [Desulfofundulus thermobenzoicus]|uniref:DUF1847 domain-containing protein n=1 Tax=Desulfofundulus thermobenzoicus TaxID=29376 RepID=A0A6N7IQU1_9FIRM|nr:DUF1847 domain-containing protein [Desulfofundulus thermobenzoicus]MQL52392.1 DUF1847 domain-containing protein [Desulfofundulus thermobenzoicus]HHW43136.1 DUF1847 domain-containing protein [Desulfotomaculum sp.]